MFLYKFPNNDKNFNRRNTDSNLGMTAKIMTSKSCFTALLL